MNLRLLRCKLFGHGDNIVSVIDDTYTYTHDYCDRCKSVLYINNWTAYLRWIHKRAYESLCTDWPELYGTDGK